MLHVKLYGLSYTNCSTRSMWNNQTLSFLWPDKGVSVHHYYDQNSHLLRKIWIHEFYLCLMTMEVYISIGFGDDKWMIPLTIFIGHSYLLFKFHLSLDKVLPVSFPAFYLPVVIQWLIYFNINFIQWRTSCWFIAKSWW
jgi:Zn-dependent protease with chaperone function